MTRTWTILMKANNLGVQSAAMRAAQMFFSAFNPRDDSEQRYKDRLVHRQAKRRARLLSSWSGTTTGAREEARRRQQMGYDAGLLTRRALPRSY